MNFEEKIEAVRALRVASAKSKETVDLVPEDEHVKAPKIIWCAFKLNETCHQCGKCQKGRKYKDKNGQWRISMDLSDHQMILALKEGTVLAYGYGTNEEITTPDDVCYGDIVEDNNSIELWNCY